MNAMNENAQQIENFAAEAQKSVSDQMEKMSRSFEDMAAFNQASMDAMMKAANTAMKSAEEMNSELMSFSKKSVEDSVAAAKEMAASKSLMELVEKQGDFAKTWMDGCMKQTAKLNELAMSASKDAFEPLAGRMTAAADLVKSQSA
jgi:phasin family protein